ncbi:ASCH domain-containing protein [Ferribacterium limneticum]|uniref:ASCH domain-containing protein n=1 Tax=Ferribacterium limneticum TaxID=76259 RepID=UPI001CFA37C5|nr:ASCH domain-containing protein [Ferribacterium limneticum]UCV28149.1 ASCH domain-containing protein [Ferribacterium limneticum]UCV32066.1 ASCH domain-containing protein [Ferribacterium limneticum]
MKVLLSIKPEYAEKILEGNKHYEFRKVIPKAPGVTTIVIYATKPVGKVVGEFDIDQFLSERPNDLWSITAEYSGITKRFFNEYFHGRNRAYAIKVKEARRYDEPLELGSVLRSGVAPQSFCYLT